jgi:hypothetical protein
MRWKTRAEDEGTQSGAAQDAYDANQPHAKDSQ